MKRFLKLTGLALVFALCSFQSDVESMIMDLKFGNLDQVSNHFYDYIELTLPDGTGSKEMNRVQAKNVLKTFFSRNGIRGFEKDSDRANGATRIITGKLTNKGDGFMLSMMLRQSGNRNIIVAIRVD